MEFNPNARDRVGIHALGHHPQAKVPPPRAGCKELADKVEEVLFGLVKGANVRSMADSRKDRVIRRFGGSGLQRFAQRHRPRDLTGYRSCSRGRESWS